MMKRWSIVLGVAVFAAAFAGELEDAVALTKKWMDKEFAILHYYTFAVPFGRLKEIRESARSDAEKIAELRRLSPDAFEAVEQFARNRRQAEQGDARSQYLMGLHHYIDGKDLAEAVKWFRKAAEQGNADAQYHLGFCLNCFIGGGLKETNPVEAEKWFRKAAEQGNADAMAYLGIYFSEDYSAEQSKWLRQAAEHGNPEAQVYLGFSCMDGKMKDMPKDPVEAVKWFRKAAEQGVPIAQWALGEAYFYGYGVPKDFAESLKWYRRFDVSDKDRGAYEIGRAYFNGYGVKKDPVEAAKWYRKAAERGDDGARLALGDLYFNGYGVKKDLAEAAKWYRKAAQEMFFDGGFFLFSAEKLEEEIKRYGKAAEAGDVNARFRLAKAYEKEAAKWYRKAAEQGHPYAQYKTGEMYYGGDSVESMDLNEAVKWYRKAAIGVRERRRSIFCTSD